MKIRIEVECTPEEARAFLGLPDVAPMQEALMAQLQEQASKAMTVMDPEALVKTWLPLGAQGLGEFQRMMFGAANSALDRARGKKPQKTPAADE